MKIFKKISVAVCMAVGLLTSSFCFAEQIQVKHAQGVTNVTVNPKRVIVYDLGILDNMDLINATDNIVALPEIEFPKYLKDLENIEKAGSLFSPDYEKIAALKPDLIIIAGRSSRNYEQLSKMFPTIDLSLRNEHTVEDSIANMRLLGKIFNKTKNAERAIKALERDISYVKSVTNKRGDALALITTGGKINLLSPQSRFGLLFSNFGIENAHKKLGTDSAHGQTISYEFILNENPDWLFVLDRDKAINNGGTPATKLLDNSIIRKTKAWNKKQIVYLDPHGFYLATGGFQSLQTNIDIILEAYQQQAKK
ncbi:siderophore ABC transporter substrate-binding protein [Bartonella sp. DGB1]|uniref:siderophore ABC transporter substrate-binding protein n=1 Tax=Bartonella sp. DGB1 TaxID=3239807 RepID=UPI0035240FF8